MADVQLISDVQLLAAGPGQLPEPEVQTTFMVVSGLPGTDKCCFCRKLAERLPLVVLESDTLRKILFSAPGYSLAESSRLFQAICQLIEKLLQKGASLILDATNLSERCRGRDCANTD